MNLACVFFLFATVSAIPTGRVEIVFPSVETSRSGVKTLKFRALGEEVELKLEPAGDILAKDFAFYNGNHEKQHSVDVESLRRRLYKDRTNGAALLIDDDEQPPLIEGIVFSKLSISPQISEDGKRAHRVEELTSDREFYLSDNIILPDFQREMDNFSRIDRDDKCIVIEVLSLTESNFTERFETEQALTEYVTLMYSAAETLLRQLDSGIQLRLSGIQAFTKETEPPFFKSNDIEDGKYYDAEILTGMKNYFCKNPITLSKNADIIMLLITRYMMSLNPDGTPDGFAAGFAYSGTVCYRCHKVGVTRDYRNVVSGSSLLAHEISHLLGVPHDGESPQYTGVFGSPGAESCPSSDGFLMGYNTGVNSEKFSQCSKDCAKYLLSKRRASCVYEKCKNSRY
uniref:Putative metalloproteinase n=1 Tax=Tityus obscurus TaxID=1221240 RepID=A0A1E1WVX8_TITOB